MGGALFRVEDYGYGGVLGGGILGRPNIQKRAGILTGDFWLILRPFFAKMSKSGGMASCAVGFRKYSTQFTDKPFFQLSIFSYDGKRQGQ